MDKVRLGLVIAQKDFTELERFVTADVDVLLFPEGFLDSDNIAKAQELTSKNGKWLITGVDDRRQKDKKIETAIVINPQGKIIGEHQKTSITRWEIDHGYSRGDSINTITTDFSIIGISICYEIHFPEITRVYALNGAEIIFNPIGTGMWHENQYRQWNNIASARASENGVFVVGCSHFTDTIPIAYAYAPDGMPIVTSREINRLIPVTIDPTKYDDVININKRRPELYQDLVEAKNN